MKLCRACALAATAFSALIGLAAPSHALSGTVRVTVVKAGLVVGAGAGRGTLTFRHRNYSFVVRGLSFGLSGGASVNRLVGRADYIGELSDFSGTYTVTGGGLALIGGISGVQLKNDKGVIITLQGVKAGLEVAANVGTVAIILDPSRSTPN